MKKIVVFLVLFLLPFSVYASKQKVVFSKCVDGDTAKVILNKKEIKLRFLAVDTPESVHPTKKEEPFGKEASNYTCDRLTNAKSIEIEYDPNSDKTDKYDRYLVWIYVDNELFQKELVSKGYAKVAYLYGDYLYTKDLEKLEKVAKKDKLKIWSSYVESKETTDEYDTIIEYIINLIYQILKKIIDFVCNIVSDML